MINLKQAREQGKLEQFVTEREAENVPDVGSSRRTLAALEERGFIYGGHIYGCRVRSYIIQDPGRDYLASADILPKGQDEGLAGTESGAVVSESEPDARKPVP